MSLRQYIHSPVSILPLVTFRVLFGMVMLVGTIRFVANGWVDLLYVKPSFYFPFWDVSWLKPLSQTGMYLLFGVMALAALGIALGAYYRFSTWTFFLSFTFVELLDKTNYLNHYYFVSVVALLLCFLPANRAVSWDVWRNPELSSAQVPRWVVGCLRFQIGLVYFFAGVAKLNPDWMFHALPLKIWLEAKTDLPLLGSWLGQDWVAFGFSWFGALYDLSVPFFLFWNFSRPWAYATVVVFHLMTWLLFPIGMFPFIMILGTLVFFPAEVHATFWNKLKWIPVAKPTVVLNVGWAWIVVLSLLVIQTLFPLRSWLYPGNLFWTEQGFRFSWRVMLMEKAGHATFRVRDPRTGYESEVNNRVHLTPYQEKMMSTQPDMILQYAHHLDAVFRNQGIPDPEVYADVFVALNGRGSRRFVNPKVDLSQERDGWRHKDWILPYEGAEYSQK